MSLPAPLMALVQSEQLNSILCVGSDQPNSEPDLSSPAGHCSVRYVDTDLLLSETFQERFDLVWLSEKTLAEAAQQRTALIAKCRDQLSSKVLLALSATEDGGLSETDCLGLGFVRCALTGQQRFYLFDLKTYKPAPDWLNPRFWANPQNWNKFRW